MTTEIIAEREFNLNQDNGSNVVVRVSISKPYPDPETIQTWVCEIEVDEGNKSSIFITKGGDSLQSLLHATETLKQLIKGLGAKYSSRLTFLGQSENLTL